MDVGLGLTFQNLHERVTDRDVFRHELDLAARAEDMGFDSVWTPEHHFTGYMMTPNVPQFLSWVAAKTSRIKLGTTVTVLPWQNPVRIAESFLLLDHYSEGRAVLGAGSARRSSMGSTCRWAKRASAFANTPRPSFVRSKPA